MFVLPRQSSSKLGVSLSGLACLLIQGQSASEVEIEDSSASATVDSPDDDVVMAGDDDTIDDGVGDGDSAGSNVNGGGKIDSCLTTTRVATDGVRTAGREDGGPHETVLPLAVAAAHAVFAFAVCCFALFNTLWSTMNWITCATGLSSNRGMMLSGQHHHHISMQIIYFREKISNVPH